MNFLLDTHTFIWMDSSPSQLSANVVDILKDKKNTLYLSVISVWEIEIKIQIGKLSLNKPLIYIIQEQQKNNGLQILTMNLGHALKVSELVLHHKDPFDRLLIAQALVEDYTLISKDTIFEKYPASVVW